MIVHSEDIFKNFNKETDFLFHGCNCCNKMGAGIAKYIAIKFPEAYRVDQETNKYDLNKLGRFTYAESCGVVNLYTQFKTGNWGLQAQYRPNILNECLTNFAKEFEPTNKNYKMPLIGCGLAGGFIGDFIDNVLNFEQFLKRDVFVYIDEYSIKRNVLTIFKDYVKSMEYENLVKYV